MAVFRNNFIYKVLQGHKNGKDNFANTDLFNLYN